VIGWSQWSAGYGQTDHGCSPGTTSLFCTPSRPQLGPKQPAVRKVLGFVPSCNTTVNCDVCAKRSLVRNVHNLQWRRVRD
jgi:hypothetical protein